MVCVGFRVILNFMIFGRWLYAPYKFAGMNVKEPSVSTMLLNVENEFDPYGAMSTPLYQTATFKQVALWWLLHHPLYLTKVNKDTSGPGLKLHYMSKLNAILVSEFMIFASFIHALKDVNFLYLGNPLRHLGATESLHACIFMPTHVHDIICFDWLWNYFLKASATENGPYDYTRSGNPTRDALERYKILVLAYKSSFSDSLWMFLIQSFLIVLLLSFLV